MGTDLRQDATKQDGVSYPATVGPLNVQTPMVTLGSVATNLAAGANEIVAGGNAGGFFDVASRARLFLGRASTGGAYQLDLEWSRDGATIDLTETVAVGDATTVGKEVAMPFVRVRVRNTGGTAFTAHRTTVTAR
jgi:hypothetical protein